MKINFITKSKNNRVFCDAMIRYLAVEILLSGVLDEDMKLSSYSKYDYEVKTGKHGGFKFVKICDNIKSEELIYLKGVVKQGFLNDFNDIYSLRNFLADKLNVDDDYLHCLNEPNNLEHSFKIALKKRKEKTIY